MKGHEIRSGRFVAYAIGAMLLPILLVPLLVVALLDFALGAVHVLSHLLRGHLTQPTLDALAKFAPKKWRPEKSAAGGCLDCGVICETREEWDEHLRQHQRQALPRKS